MANPPFNVDFTQRPEWTTSPFIVPQKRRRDTEDEDDDMMMGEVLEINATLDDQLSLIGRRGKPEPEHWTAQPLKTRRDELTRLGPVPDRMNCFGCVNLDDDVKGVIQSDEIIKLKEMARSSFGRTDLISLVRAMESYYAKFIMEPVNEALKPGETPLGPWTAAQILDHIRNHNQDPFIQQIVVGAEIQEMRAQSAECCFEMSDKGKMRVNPQAIAAYERLTKLQFAIMKLKASEMSNYSGNNALVDREVQSEGLISTKTKRVHRAWGLK